MGEKAKTCFFYLYSSGVLLAIQAVLNFFFPWKKPFGCLGKVADEKRVLKTKTSQKKKNPTKYVYYLGHIKCHFFHCLFFVFLLFICM